MMNYRIWKCDGFDNYLLIEVFNESDIPSIQKHFIEKGYIILQTEKYIFGYHFIKVEKVEEL